MRKKDIEKIINKIAYMRHDEIQRRYKDHVYLRKKGKGVSKALKGDVVLIVFYVNDGESKWTKADIEASKKTYNSAFSLLYTLAEGRYVDLKLRCAFQEISVPMVCTRENRREWRKAISGLFNKSSLTEYQEYYKKKYNCDEAPIIFTFNRDFRSYAVSDDDEKSTCDEFSVIRSNCSEKTIIHELLHQFGAVDFYFPKEVAKVLEEMEYKSVMNGDMAEAIDALTAYLIGWTDWITDKAATILEKTKHYTPDMLAEAKKQEWNKSGN